MVQWTKRVCDYLLGLGLLPHINIGLLDFASLRYLKEVSASMGLMIEGDYGKLSNRIQPQKNFQERLKNLEWAGKLQIPFTTGILMGLGESQRDRIRSIEAILACAKAYGHVQEIILQNYALNLNSTIPACGIPHGELKELITLCKDEAPEISIQIPPNLYPDWPNLLALGVNDLGGISQQDVVNSQSPWPPISEIAGILEKKKYTLRKRLPLYVGYYRRGWYSERVGAVIEKWIQAEDEYRYYAQ
jgi:FO synthase subunit 1